MPGWMKHENFVPDKTNRAFDLQLMKTSKAKDVTRTMMQDRTRLDQVLKGVSRDYKKRMNQITSETNKWKKKAEKLRESKESEDGTVSQPGPPTIRRRGSLDSSILMSQHREFTRRISRTMLSVDNIPGSGSPQMSRRVQSGKLSGRRASLDPTILLRQKHFFSKIAKLANSQNSDDTDDERDSPPASPPPITRSRQGRRGSLPTMHLGLVTRPSTASQMPALELIQEIERRGSQNSEGEKDDNLIEKVESENREQIKNEHKGGSESSKLTVTKMLPRRPAICVKQSPRSFTDLHPGDKKEFGMNVEQAESSNDDDTESVTSSRSHRSRSNSLFDSKSIRLTRRRNSTPVAENLPDGLSLAEQFHQLRSCRYLRGRTSIPAEEDCDLSNVFG